VEKNKNSCVASRDLKSPTVMSGFFRSPVPAHLVRYAWYPIPAARLIVSVCPRAGGAAFSFFLCARRFRFFFSYFHSSFNRLCFSYFRFSFFGSTGVLLFATAATAASGHF
jgi:hypothetical protein